MELRCQVLDDSLHAGDHASSVLCRGVDRMRRIKRSEIRQAYPMPAIVLPITSMAAPRVANLL